MFKHYGYTPLSLIEYHLTNNKIKLLLWYLILKYHSNSGKFYVNKESVGYLADCIGVSYKTVYRQINALHTKHYVGKDSYGTLYIRNYAYVLKILDVKNSRRVEINSQVLKPKKFKSYCLASWIGIYLSRRLYKMEKDQGRNIRRSLQRSPKNERTLQIDVSFRFLSEKFGISKSEIHRLVNVASKNGYLYKQKRRKITTIPIGQVKPCRKSEHFPEGFPVVVNGKVVLNCPNRYAYSMVFRKRTSRLNDRSKTSRTK